MLHQAVSRRGIRTPVHLLLVLVLLLVLLVLLLVLVLVLALQCLESR